MQQAGPHAPLGLDALRPATGRSSSVGVGPPQGDHHFSEGCKETCRGWFCGTLPQNSPRNTSSPSASLGHHLGCCGKSMFKTTLFRAPHTEHFGWKLSCLIILMAFQQPRSLHTSGSQHHQSGAVQYLIARGVFREQQETIFHISPFLLPGAATVAAML